MGNLNINLKVFIRFRDFAMYLLGLREFRTDEFRNWKPTEEQKKDFKWNDGERDKFKKDFAKIVKDKWSNKHTLELNETDFQPYKSRVNIEVSIAGRPHHAHVRMTAQKMPKNSPRIRSFAQSRGSAVLDIRDPSEEEEHEYLDIKYVRQIGSFKFDDANSNPTTDSQMKEYAQELKSLLKGKNIKRFVLYTFGRASSQGQKEYNKQLAMKRAKTVEAYMKKEFEGTGLLIHADSHGEENASSNKKFRRVDLMLVRKDESSDDPLKPLSAKSKQNVAAHEAGHMFGLGDEYKEEKSPSPHEEGRFRGDKPTHFQDVEETLGKDAANELYVKGSDNIMSHGNKVKAGHYVYFVKALNAITGKKWNIDK